MNKCDCNQGRKPCTCRRLVKQSDPDYETAADRVIVVLAIVVVGYWVAGWLAGVIR